MNLLVCIGSTGLPQRWARVFDASRTVARIGLLLGVADHREPVVPAFFASGPVMVVGVGSAAGEAHRLASWDSSVFHVVLADPVAADRPTGSVDIPVTVLSSAPLRTAATDAAAVWRTATSARFEVRTVPATGDPGEFVYVALRHLHEAGLITGLGDNGDSLGIRG